VAKNAKLAQILAIHAQVILCVKLVNQDMDCKVINAKLAPLELSSQVNPVKLVLIHVQVALVTPAVRLARLDMAYKAANALLAHLEHT